MTPLKALFVALCGSALQAKIEAAAQEADAATATATVTVTAFGLAIKKSSNMNFTL